MKNVNLLIALPAVAMLVASMPSSADARTKDIVKYGAIGIGVAALANMAQQNNNSYYRQPYYGGYYQQPYYGGYYQQSYYPSYNYGYSGYYQQPYYGGYYGGYGY